MPVTVLNPQAVPAEGAEGINNEKRINEGARDVPLDESDNSSGYKQDGVKNVEAVTIAWSKKMLWVSFVL